MSVVDSIFRPFTKPILAVLMRILALHPDIEWDGSDYKLTLDGDVSDRDCGRADVLVIGWVFLVCLLGLQVVDILAGALTIPSGPPTIVVVLILGWFALAALGTGSLQKEMPIVVAGETA